MSFAERLGALPLAGLPAREPVSVRWNAWAVPFVRARHDTDAAAALGVVHRHLRQAQLEVLRRIAAGRVAAMIGPLGLPFDEAVFALGLADAVPAIIAGLPDGTRAWAEAFVAGLNHHGARAAPAPELAPLGIGRFEPWTLADFFTLARLYSADLTWPVLRRLLSLRDGLSPASWRQRWPLLLRAEAAPDPASLAGPDALLGRATRFGSNAGAVDASRSASGAPLLGGDPHLSTGLPNAWLLAGIASPGIEAVGLMLPGMPFVACGRNRDIAWGGTSLHAAASEFVDVSGLPASAFTTETRAVAVRGQRRPATISRQRTPHGPVVSDGALFPARGTLALRWTGHRPSDELTAMLGVLRARDAPGFRAALDGFGGPGQCMVYAGPDGIGRQVAVHLPRRDPAPPEDLVLTPAAADASWADHVTGSSLFGEWNPASGFVASANERLDGPPPDRVPLGRFFAAADRVSRLRTLLGPGRGRFDLTAFAAVFRDAAQPNALDQRDRLLAHLPRVRPSRRDAIADALASWDGGYEVSSPGALAFELLLAGTARALLPADALGAANAVWATRALLADAFCDAEGPRLARAVAAALPEASRRFRRLRVWGAAHRHRLAHPFGGVPLLGRRFRGPAFPGRGGNDTLDKTGHGLVRGRHVIRFGGTARYAFDLADPDGGECVLFGGQDGWLGSANWADQVALWQAGRAIAMPLRAAAVAAAFPIETVLTPG